MPKKRLPYTFLFCFKISLKYVRIWGPDLTMPYCIPIREHDGGVKSEWFSCFPGYPIERSRARSGTADWRDAIPSAISFPPLFNTPRIHTALLCHVAKVTWIEWDYTIASFAARLETCRFGFSSHARTEASTVVSNSECWRIAWRGERKRNRRRNKDKKGDEREKSLARAAKYARVSYILLSLSFSLFWWLSRFLSLLRRCNGNYDWLLRNRYLFSRCSLRTGGFTDAWFTSS